MQEIVYHTNFKLEESYFWFKARNRIVKELFEQHSDLKQGDKVLDIGCGTGGFASTLLAKYHVSGLDTEPLALEYSRKRGLSDLSLGLLSDYKVQGESPKAAFMLDVIEHIEDDVAVVKEVYDLLPSGAWFVATVPAYKWLWSIHDIMHMHFRRYTKPSFKKLIEGAGFEIKYSSYFNTFLFPIAALRRLLESKDKPIDKDKYQPVDKLPNFLNSIFKSVFSSELPFLKRLSFPFGLSIIVIARKP